MGKIRSYRGGSIYLIIASVLILVIIGVAFICISRIMSGGMEVANAVDAGTLNVAKQALVNPTVDVMANNTSQFANLGENNSNNISLATYNRAVALAMMVAANAEDENTAEARAHAQQVFEQLKRLQMALSQKFETDPALGGAFTNLARPNVPRMLGQNSTVQDRGDIRSGYYMVGGASNVYFANNQLPAGVDLTPYLVTDPQAGTAPGGERWLSGYRPVSIGGRAFYATPVFPGKTPHLISDRDFGDSQSVGGDATQAVLPNCFRKGGTATAQQSNTNLETQASATVGALNRQYPARFPNGYIRIVNPQGIDRGYVGSLTTDGTNDLFNKELFAPSTITQSMNGVFTTDKDQMAAWVRYNNSTGDDEYGRDGSLNPERLGFNVGNMRFGSGRNQRATLQQLLGVVLVECACTHTDFDRTASGPCESQQKVNTWQGNYGRGSVNQQFSSQRGFISIEKLKAQCLEERARVGRNFGVIIQAPPPTGLMRFTHGAPYPIPQFPAEFAQVGTPWQLMQQVGTCATTANGSAFSRLYRRCRQIKPDCTPQEVEAVLDSRQIPLGTTLYLYVDSAGALVMDTNGPPNKTNVAPDGPADVSQCLVQYDFEGASVNTARALGTADAGFEDRPWTQASCPKAMDQAMWTDSSGFENLLGVLRFQNSVMGPSEFGAPN